jgi:hypothetical protein
MAMGRSRRYRLAILLGVCVVLLVLLGVGLFGGDGPQRPTRPVSPDVSSITRTPDDPAN